MMLAEAQPTPESFLQFWLIVALFVSIAGGLVGIITSIIIVTSNKKQKREVTFGFEPASKEAFEKHLDENRKDIDVLHSKIGSSERESRRIANEAVSKLSTDMTEVAVKVGALTESNNAQNQQLAVINSDIKTILTRLPRARHGDAHE